MGLHKQGREVQDEAMVPQPDDLHADSLPFSKPWRWAAALCLLIACCGAGYLAITSLTGGMIAGCGQGSGCNQVLSSRWAYWFGLPVSVPALGLYLALLAGALLTLGGSQAAHRRLQVLVLSVGPLIIGCAIWFVCVQEFFLKSWCKVCLTTHVSATLGVCLLLVETFRNSLTPQSKAFTIPSLQSLRTSAAVTILGLGILIAGQTLVNKRLYVVSSLAGASPVVSGRLVVHGGKFELIPSELPHIGSPAASNFIVSVFDYTCSHCRALHPLLKAAEAKYAGQLGIIALPTPLDAKCNPLILITAPANENSCEYARLGLAVWKARPEAFAEFDDWMFSSSAPPTLEQARAKAQTLAGKEVLGLLSGSWVEHQLERNIALYQANGRMIGDGRLPQLIIGDVVTHGSMESLQDLTSLLEQHLRLGHLPDRPR